MTSAKPILQSTKFVEFKKTKVTNSIWFDDLNTM